MKVRDRWEEMTWNSATQPLRVIFIYECWILLYRAVNLLTGQILSFGVCEGRSRVAHSRAPELCSYPTASLRSQLGVSSVLRASPACLVRLQCFPALCDFRNLPFSSQIHSDPSASVLVGCINPIKIQPKAQEVPRDFWRNPFPHFSLSLFLRWTPAARGFLESTFLCCSLGTPQCRQLAWMFSFFLRITAVHTVYCLKIAAAYVLASFMFD